MDSSPRPSLPTVIAVAVVAYAACDMIHEALGHGLACALTPGVRVLSISTVALQTSAESRMVAAAGSIANVVAGALLFALLRTRKKFGPAVYFLWLLATLSLLNGTGYLFFSGLFDVGDWSVVIAGLKPHGVWRAGMAVLGMVAYRHSIALSASSLTSFVRSGSPARRDVVRLVIPSYVAGGLLLVAGAARNRISPDLIWLSGVSSGFGAMAGLLVVPRIVLGATQDSAVVAPALRASLFWLILGVLTLAFFVGVLGPGVPIPHR